MKKLVNCLVAVYVCCVLAEATEYQAQSKDESTLQTVRNLQTTYNKQQCYEPLGCLSIDSSWYVIPYRLVNRIPTSRESVNTTFILYTRTNPQAGITFKTETLDAVQPTFVPSRETKFIVHGYLQNGATDRWITKLVRALLDVGDFNVISVNWGDGAGGLYDFAAGNARLVGLEIAYLVNTMVQKRGLNPANVHIIGHSLGSHIAGYAGEKISKLGRITGLDPAGPAFLNTPSHVRLDPSDASFIDVIHTNGQSDIIEARFGTNEPVGHIDFYPNGGRDQPGCELPNLLLNGSLDLGDIIFCSHRRSVDLFTDAVTSSVDIIGYQCDDYKSFLQGNCNACGADNSKCALLGLRANLYPLGNRTKVKMYLQTRAAPPYASPVASTSKLMIVSRYLHGKPGNIF